MTQTRWLSTEGEVLATSSRAGAALFVYSCQRHNPLAYEPGPRQDKRPVDEVGVMRFTESELVIEVQRLAALVRSDESSSGGWRNLAAALCAQSGMDMSDILTPEALARSGGDPMSALMSTGPYKGSWRDWPKQTYPVYG